MKKQKKILIWSLLGVLVLGLVIGQKINSSGNEIAISFDDSKLEEPNLANKYSTYLNSKGADKEKKIDFKKEVLPSSFNVSKALSSLEGFDTPSIILEETDSLYFEISVPSNGFYNLYFTYKNLADEYGSSEISVKINGETPYFEASQITLQQLWESVEEEKISLDRYGNENLPEQRQVDKVLTNPLRDSSLIYDLPLGFYLNSGLNKIEVEMLGGSINLAKIEVRGNTPLISYDDYYNDQKLVDCELLTYEAEKFASKSSSTIQKGSSNDPSVTPYNIKRIRMNVVGSDTYNEAGDRVDWKVFAPKAGYYNIAFKAIQGEKNTTSYRSLYVNDVIPFEEARNIPFRYSSKFNNYVIGDLNNNPYAIYLNEGENTISLEVNVQKNRIVSETLTKITNEMNDLGLKVKSVTGNSQDKEIDWDMEEYFEDIHETFASWEKSLVAIIDYLTNLNGYSADSYSIKDIRNALTNVRTLKKDVNKLPTRLTLLSEGSSCAAQFLVAQVAKLTTSSLTIDKLYIYSTDVSLPTAVSNIFKRTANSIGKFFISFFDQNYSSKTKDDEVLIWMGRSRQYCNTLQKMIDSEFTPKTGIKAKVVLLADEGKIILSNAANREPDVACGISTWIPNEYGMRGAIYDLRNFPDYGKAIQDYYSEQLIPLIYNDQLFGLPETENFYCLFYRKDILNQLSLNVPSTWNDVIDLLPILERFGMDFYIPLSANVSSKSYDATAPFIWQFGGQLYDIENLSSGIGDENTIKALQFMTDLYREYSLPYQVSNFFNNFRYGNMPLGIADYGTYLQLLNAAPEIRGLWGISVVPGIEREGTVHRYMGGGQQASMIFKDSDKLNESWEFLKWWNSKDTQLNFSSKMVSTYGRKYLWNTANISAFEELNWDKDDKKVILEQWSWLKEVEKIPGSYIIEREISNIWNSVVFNDQNLRSTVSDSIIKQNKEITRKMQEFGFMDEQGKVIKTFIYPTSEDIDKWKQGGN